MSSLLTLAILIGISAVLFVMLIASGKKKTASPVVGRSTPEPVGLSKEEAVVLEWYDGVKKAEFRDSVLKDVASKLKKPVSE